jgi:hypothetical protein
MRERAQVVAFESAVPRRVLDFARAESPPGIWMPTPNVCARRTPNSLDSRSSIMRDLQIAGQFTYCSSIQIGVKVRIHGG